MGLLGRLVTFPLEPVRGVVWMAERLGDEAERQRNDDSSTREQLAQLVAAYDRGEIDAGDYDRMEEDLLRRMRQVTHVLDSEDGR